MRLDCKGRAYILAFVIVQSVLDAHLGFSVFSGRIAGPSAARYAADLAGSGAGLSAGMDAGSGVGSGSGLGSGAGAGAVSEGQISDIEKRFNAPLSRTGSISVNDFVFEIQKVMQPLGNSLYKHEERLTKAIEKLLDLRSQLGTVEAKSPHHLFGVNEAEAMLLCGELFFRASLKRKESIGWFTREDYPDPPKELHYILIENDSGNPKLTSEPVVFKDHWIKPDQVGTAAATGAAGEGETAGAAGAAGTAGTE
jgi:succinate dehydrogenase/fumarate reductase flavoprotein subunit